MSTDLPIDLNAIEARLDKAYDHVCDIAQRRATWKMSIPADEERDSDLIITGALWGGQTLLAEVRKLRANVRSGRLTCDISAALRRLADGRPEIAPLLHESAVQLDELLTNLAAAETVRDEALAEVKRHAAERDRVLALCRKVEADAIYTVDPDDIRAIYARPSTEEARM